MKKLLIKIGLILAGIFTMVGVILKLLMGPIKTTSKTVDTKDVDKDIDDDEKDLEVLEEQSIVINKKTNKIRKKKFSKDEIESAINDVEDELFK